MENNIEDLVAALTTTTSMLSDDIFTKLSNIFQELDIKLLLKFVNENFATLFILEHWIWKILSEDFSSWINQSKYLELFHSLSLFNKSLIFNLDEFDAEKKAFLLLPETTNLINNLFESIEKIDDENSPYFTIINLWFDNLSYFIHDYPQFVSSSIITNIDQSIASKFIMTDQYKCYLTQLQQSPISPSTFTNKQLFYIKTCSFSLSCYLFSRDHKFPFTPDEILHYLEKDYLKIIYIHSFHVQSWSKELLACITHMINFICACCWWSDNRAERIQIFLPSKEICQEHIKSLIRIVSCKTFHQQIQMHRSNDETILIDSILGLLLAILEIHDLVCFIRTETNLLEILLLLAEISGFHRISLCAYGMVGEIICDEHLQELKIKNNLCEYFFYMLEQAWKNPAQKFQRVSVSQLLKGFLSLAKSDTIQQKAADSNKLSVLIEMCDKYSIVYDILWALSFNHDIQNQIRSNRKLMLKLTHLKHDLNTEQMRKTIHGILWNLKFDHEDRDISEKDDEAMFDIMISYSHKDKILSKQLYDQLTKVGYHVWIDFDQIHGNVMDAMAKAIEQSKTILICMSEQYRRSNYCRAEAYYAFQRQLKIVPVLLEKNYKPDGWLLFLIGQLLYVDFTKYEFLQAMDMLIKELNAPISRQVTVERMESNKDTNIMIANSPLPLPTALLPIHSNDILEWTQSEVQDWLVGHNLVQMSHLLSDYDGSSLVYLNKYLTNSDQSTQILKLLQEDSLRRTNQSLSLIELARFQTLVDQQQKQTVESKITKKRTKKTINEPKWSHSNLCKIM